jgi:hypothetical protein
MQGCESEKWSGAVPGGDAASLQAFQATVYPVLMRDCSFNACHGAPHRFFQVFGPGRTRIGLDPKSEDPATMAEIQTSYARAVAMLITDGPVTRSLLLSKPLEGRAGGVGHRGADNFGRNVYQTTMDPNYLALYTWASTVPTTAAKPSAMGTAGARGTAGVQGTAGATGRSGSGAAGRVGTAGVRGTAGR